MHPDKVPENLRDLATRFVQKLASSYQLACQYVEQKSRISGLNEANIPIPPTLSYILNTDDQDKHLSLIVHHGMDPENFNFIDLEYRDDEEDLFSFATTRDLSSEPLFSNQDEDSVEVEEVPIQNESNSQSAPSNNENRENDTEIIDVDDNKVRNEQKDADNDDTIENYEIIEDEIDVAKNIRESKQRYRKRMKDQARQCLLIEKPEVESLVPQRVVQIKLNKEVEFSKRWQCERF
ncbi:MAG: hypothetical protein AAF549_09810, partial [Pseudomonadota bacterium]